MKKIAICLLLIISFSNISFAKNFKDVPQDYWANKFINSLSNEKIITGYKDKTFKPDKLVTRAEFITMVIKTLNKNKIILNKKANFIDLKETHWAYNNIQTAYQLKLISGFPDGTIKPDQNISKLKASIIITNALKPEKFTEKKANELLSLLFDKEKIPN